MYDIAKMVRIHFDCNKIDQCRESFTGAPRGYAEDEA